MIVAARNNYMDIVCELVDHGADVKVTDVDGSTALIYACSCGGNLKAVIRLLDKGADINSKNSDGRTALDCAVFSRNIEIEEELLKRGAKLNTKTIE